MNKRAVAVSTVLAVAIVGTIFVVRSGRESLPSADDLKVPTQNLTGAIGGAPIGGGKLSPMMELVSVKPMPVQWVAPMQSEIGVNVTPSSVMTDPMTVELYLDGVMIDAEQVPARASKVVGTVVKSDGQVHEMMARVFKVTLDGPRVQLTEKKFPVELPAQ